MEFWNQKLRITNVNKVYKLLVIQLDNVNKTTKTKKVGNFRQSQKNQFYDFSEITKFDLVIFFPFTGTGSKVITPHPQVAALILN